MKKEYYHRISKTYIIGERTIKEDDSVSTALNDALEFWIKEMSRTYRHFQYRIVNSDTCYMAPSQAVPSMGYAIISLHIAYTINTD